MEPVGIPLEVCCGNLSTSDSGVLQGVRALTPPHASAVDGSIDGLVIVSRQSMEILPVPVLLPPVVDGRIGGSANVSVS